ncbi:uncharacterized protein C8Q71DRAFT_859685 [Rhodofomes roseus]|uniref:Uncharacterized protein n=1 Tax=Rhodofomes roseus TaxID=34475 RepID=A0ABQ8K9F0_9APHY|nr:uncharacterized protein C8Q71DRAFT_859685 [Rhodofomes roseus]KAH9834011.1 hypothetical protein C8Q71DRAFT_859685 [Rhodofomes roseus]
MAERSKACDSSESLPAKRVFSSEYSGTGSNPVLVIVLLLPTSTLAGLSWPLPCPEGVQALPPLAQRDPAIRKPTTSESGYPTAPPPPRAVRGRGIDAPAVRIARSNGPSLPLSLGSAGTDDLSFPARAIPPARSLFCTRGDQIEKELTARGYHKRGAYPHHSARAVRTISSSTSPLIRRKSHRFTRPRVGAPESPTERAPAYLLDSGLVDVEKLALAPSPQADASREERAQRRRAVHSHSHAQFSEAVRRTLAQPEGASPEGKDLSPEQRREIE